MKRAYRELYADDVVDGEVGELNRDLHALRNQVGVAMPVLCCAVPLVVDDWDLGCLVMFF